MSSHKIKMPDTATRQRHAEARRTALTEAQLSTYTFAHADGAPIIVCLCCGSISYNPNDILQRYCGNCHQFHSEGSEP